MQHINTPMLIWGDAMQSMPSQHAVRTARRYFFEEGQSAQGLVSDTILRSWQRCTGIGLDAARAPRIEPMSAGQLRQERERNDQLQRLCQPELQALCADARDTDSMVILTDSQGLVLDSLGSATFMSQAQRVALRPGVVWHESSTGTNAIGTALAERRAVEVRGAEHFFDPYHVLSCFAAPIFDPQGQVVGALDISGRATVSHTHALGMVRMAVDQIEHRFFEQAPAGCEVLRLHSDAALLGTAREGVLVFRDRCLVAANRFGLGLLGLDWMVLGRQRFDELFASRPATLTGVSHLALLDGRKLHVRSKATHVRTLPRVIGVPAATPSKPLVEPIITSAELRLAQQQAACMLDAEIPVLLQGETGVGKEVFARTIHQLSRWGHGPFVAVNCAALPAGLIESELFGYESGAFTGARKEGAAGLLRQAQGGVLLLDEIGDMPMELQSRLLRVLQEREVAPLGGKPVPVSFALVCSTHCALTDMVASRQFRGDLYYRIAHHVVQLPALRELQERVIMIADYWLQLLSASQVTSAMHDDVLPPVLLAALSAYHWPGNYRQLQGVLKRMAVLATMRGTPAALRVADLPADIQHASSVAFAVMPDELADASHADQSLEAQQERSMQAALDACQGNVSRAARLLGVNRSTLYRRLLAKQGAKSG